MGCGACRAEIALRSSSASSFCTFLAAVAASLSCGASTSWQLPSHTDGSASMSSSVPVSNISTEVDCSVNSGGAR